MEGLEECASFIVTASVKLASEPGTEIMWLQASCKTASPRPLKGHPNPLPRAGGGRQGLGFVGAPAPVLLPARRGGRRWYDSSRSTFPYMGKRCSNFWSCVLWQCWIREFYKQSWTLVILICLPLSGMLSVRLPLQGVLAAFMQAGSQRFPTYFGFSNRSVNQGYGTGEGVMLRCSRTASGQRAAHTGHFALVVWWDSL